MSSFLKGTILSNWKHRVISLREIFQRIDIIFFYSFSLLVAFHRVSLQEFIPHMLRILFKCSPYKILMVWRSKKCTALFPFLLETQSSWAQSFQDFQGHHHSISSFYAYASSLSQWGASRLQDWPIGAAHTSLCHKQGLLHQAGRHSLWA